MQSASMQAPNLRGDGRCCKFHENGRSAIGSRKYVENDGNLQWTASAQWEALSWERTHQTHQQALMKLHCRRDGGWDV